MQDGMFPLEAAEKLGPYELITELASGGMATVYLARRAGLGGFSRSVAIKRLKSEIAQAPPFLAMLIDEANLAARIHHPNVAATLEFGTDGDEHYLVMEYVEGGSLLDLVGRSLDRGEVLAPRVVLRIALDALAGLHAAHELTGDDGAPLHLVHRDLSPHNLMVGLDGSTRIVDFGLARATSRLTKTAVGTLKGKLAYMAPEQLHQRPLDRRVDIFAAGVVLWEGLRGQRLFKADTDVATIERVLRGDIPSLRQSLPWLSPGVNAVVMKALARDPDRRFATAEEMGSALAEAAEAADLVGSRKEVSAAVAKLMGDDLAARREQLRKWAEKHDKGRPLPLSKRSTPSAFTVPAHGGRPSGDVEAMMVIVDKVAAAPPPAARPARRSRHDDDVLTTLPPATATEMTALVPRRSKRSWWPLIGGLAVAGCLVAAALLAGGGIAGLPGEPRPAALPPAAPPPVATAAVPQASTSAVVPAPPVTEIVAAPEVPEPPTNASGSSSEIIARPEPPTTAPPRPRAPRGGGPAPKDMANPYK